MFPIFDMYSLLSARLIKPVNYCLNSCNLSHRCKMVFWLQKRIRQTRTQNQLFKAFQMILASLPGRYFLAIYMIVTSLKLHNILHHEREINLSTNIFYWRRNSSEDEMFFKHWRNNPAVSSMRSTKAYVYVIRFLTSVPLRFSIL